MQLEIRDRVLLALAAGAITAACGSSAGTRPHDMSAAGHEEAARVEESAAAGQEARYDPYARARRCGGSRTLVGLGFARGPRRHGGRRWASPCWSDAENPTERFLADAARHRELAAAHREAAAELRSAEGRACVGIEELDRDMSPFAHRDDIASVEPIVETIQTDEQQQSRPVGATIVFRAVRGMNTEWLQRVVDCHLARNASLGHDVPEMPYCPLVPRGVTARVRSVQDGFAVDVRVEDPDSVAEVVRRAQSLLAPA